MAQAERMQWHIASSFYIFIAMMLLTLPLHWLLAVAGAAAIHECSHIAALRLLGVPVRRLELDIGGARLISGPLTPSAEILCAAAGPLGGLLSLPLARWLPALAVCCFAQSIFNLLPIYPLDGGRIMRCILRLFLPAKQAAAGETVAHFLVFMMFAFFALKVMTVLRGECIPFLLVGIFLVLAKKKKKPLQC